ncbi:HD domain-containing protein [Maribacter sp. ACAM166]|uniref:HD domain-containing protein n=1 Tax=Maribacter sp. ACAM166 TaxID=2508996 RepID=UPI0010FDAA3F|nr:HD domain-containing protein [Maribacter sp. ACAM166]TLP80265.1 hypothetical protein ES765_08730 [Maribacter sp. ACAM166]
MTLHNRKAYPELCLQLLDTLDRCLPPHLSYHCVSHTIDVANVCNKYITYYDIDSAHSKLIRIAAIGHDLGYIISPVNHEERGIKTLSQLLPSILEPKEISIINGLIRATKITQQPKTFYEKIIKDADLDYLGRDDYDTLSQNLFKEFQYYNIENNQEKWLDLQINFLENHKFYTSFAQEFREPLKHQKLEFLKEKRNIYL